MIIRKLKFVEDPEYGSTGWMPIWLEGANIVTGRGAAHDILEHHPNMGLGAEAEFHALGSAYWIRGETGWFCQNSHTPTEDVLARDFISILEAVAYGNETLRLPPKTRAISSYHFGDADEVLNDITTAGVRMAKEDWASSNEGMPMDIPKDSQQRALGWMRLGYRYAIKRYGQDNQFEIEHMFNAVTQAVDANKLGDLGMEMTLRIDLRKHRVTAYTDYPWDSHQY